MAKRLRENYRVTGQKPMRRSFGIYASVYDEMCTWGDKLSVSRCLLSEYIFIKCLSNQTDLTDQDKLAEDRLVTSFYLGSETLRGLKIRAAELDVSVPTLINHFLMHEFRVLAAQQVTEQKFDALLRQQRIATYDDFSADRV
jgi:hypothetical protein